MQHKDSQIWSHLTNPNSLHHEADVSNALEVCGLVNGVDGLYMAGNLQKKGLFKQMQAFPTKRFQTKEYPHWGQSCSVCLWPGVAYLGYNSLSCDIVFKKEVVSLDKELTSVFLFGCRPFPPQNDRTMWTLLFQLCDFLFKKKLRMRQKKINCRWQNSKLE